MERSQYSLNGRGRNVFASKRLPFIAAATVLLWSYGFHGSCSRGGSVAGAADVAVQDAPVVVINELHTNPDVKTELVEFVELYNRRDDRRGPLRLAVHRGHPLHLPGRDETARRRLPHRGPEPAANPGQVERRAGRECRTNLIFGPYAGSWSNEGEQIVLCDAAGALMDEVEYQLGFPWPTVGDPASSDTQPGTGYSHPIDESAARQQSGRQLAVRGCPRRRRRTRASCADNIPPQIRQVKHSPKQPKSPARS